MKKALEGVKDQIKSYSERMFQAELLDALRPPEDGLAFTRPWGFELAEIRVPVLLWQGVQDLLGEAEHLRLGHRAVTLEDIEHFAHFTGDTFYAHMDDEAARAPMPRPFEVTGCC